MPTKLPDRIYVDTSALVAHLLVDDRWHEPMHVVMGQVETCGVTLVTANAVVLETATNLRRRKGCLGSRALADMLDSQRPSGSIIVVFEDEALMDEAQGIYDAWPDPRVSLTDAVSVAVCRKLGIGTALTLDEHFREAGFRILPDVRRSQGAPKKS